MKSKPVRLILAMTMCVAIGCQESAPVRIGKTTIISGLEVEQAIQILQRYGYEDQNAFAWAKVNPDESYRWFKIGESLTFAMTFSDTKKTITRLQVVVQSQENMSKSHEVIFAIRSIEFNADGSFLLHVEKPSNQ